MEKKICLCCNKLLENATEIELLAQWHKKCIKKFFGTNIMPQLHLDEAALEQLVTDTVAKGFTVAGVQKKLSLHLSDDSDNRLTLVGYPTGYILKPQSKDFEQLPEIEHLVMTMADAAGIKTVPHALIKTDEKLAYITKRIDRISGSTKLLAMEDFCQLSGRLTEEKYKSSYEQCAKVIKFSFRSGLDMAELFYRLIFCFVTGNSDMHLKNFSLIEDAPGSRRFELSRAYDLLAVNVVMPEDKEEFALTLNSKKANIKRKDFLIFADYCKIPQPAAEKMLKKICGMKEKLLSLAGESNLKPDLKIRFIKLIEERMERLENQG